MKLDSPETINLALDRVAQRLGFAEKRYAVVVIGGAAINLRGIVRRDTTDVDILAFGVRGTDRVSFELEEPPTPVPAPLQRAIDAVARDLTLDAHWMNTGPALQWQQGLPPGLAGRVEWRHYGPADTPEFGLDVGLVSRYDLIFFKLYAAADHATTRSVHYKDLMALRPTNEELDDAAAWVRPLDAAPEFHEIVDQLVAYVRNQLRHA